MTVARNPEGTALTFSSCPISDPSRLMENTELDPSLKVIVLVVGIPAAGFKMVTDDELA